MFLEDIVLKSRKAVAVERRLGHDDILNRPNLQRSMKEKVEGRLGHDDVLERPNNMFAQAWKNIDKTRRQRQILSRPGPYKKVKHEVYDAMSTPSTVYPATSALVYPATPAITAIERYSWWKNGEVPTTVPGAMPIASTQAGWESPPPLDSDCDSRISWELDVDTDKQCMALVEDSRLISKHIKMDTSRISDLFPPDIKSFWVENENNLKYLSYLSWALLLVRCGVLIFALSEFYYRNEGLKIAKNPTEVEKEHKRWQLKFGDIGIVDLISGLLFSVALTIIGKILTPHFMKTIYAME